ncbi:MAG: glycosyltransferase family 39 protein [Deltaproteobacteria bacterium]|jgi:hypothetical protein|nr:glycosyltransferase family 39 protein [Deltaproteobacteria bacterium]
MEFKKPRGIIFWLICYLFLLSGFIVWAYSYDNWQIKEQLTFISPLILGLNFFLILIGIIINIELFQEITKIITKKTWILVVLITLGGIILAAFVAPRTHRIFYDEDIYLNVGQNIAFLKKAGMCNEGGNLYGEYFCSQLEYNKEPNGWPYLLSVFYRLLGASHMASFLLNNILWGLSGFIIFWVGYLLFRNINTGLFGALIFIFIPEGIRWSNTTAAEPSTTFFGGLAVLAVFLFIRYPGNKPLFLASVLIPFASQFRPESILIVIPAGLGLLLLTPREFTRNRLYGFIFIALLLSLPHFIHIFAVKGEGWGAPGGVKFGLRYLKNNFSVNSLFYFNNARFPLLFSLLFFLGIVFPRNNKSNNGLPQGKFSEYLFVKEKAILLGWFFAFWGIFLCFYAGSYNYGADVRFSLMSYFPLAISAGYGVASLCGWAECRFDITWLDKGIIALIIFSFLPFMPYIRAETQEAWGARADHHFAKEIVDLLPANSLVLTHNPNMFLLWGRDAAQAAVGMQGEYMDDLFNRYKGGIYFHYNFWCNVDDPSQRSFCQNVLSRYAVKEIKSYQEQNYKFSLYQLDRIDPERSAEMPKRPPKSQ